MSSSMPSAPPVPSPFRSLLPVLLLLALLAPAPPAEGLVAGVRRIPAAGGGAVRPAGNRDAARTGRSRPSGPRPHSREAVGIVLDSTYYDYQGHGALPARIAAVGDTALHILPYVGTDPALTERGPKYIYYVGGIATNHGYVGGGGEARGGFGAVAGYDPPAGGLGNVALAAVPVDLSDSLDLNWQVFADAFQGAGAFSPFTVDPGPEVDPCDRIFYPSIWARGEASGAMAMAAMTLDDCSGGFPDIVVTHADSGSSGWSPPMVLHALDDPSAWNAGPDPPVLAGADDGTVGVVTTDFGTNVYYWESIDGGVTWGVRESITGYPVGPHALPPDSTSDAYRPLQGAALAFDPHGLPHVAWTEYQARGSGPDSIYTPGGDPLWSYRTRLVHWDPAHGATVVYRHPAGLADEARGTALAYNVGHPSIGFEDGGTYMYVAFEGFVDADRDTASGLGFGDIYASLSTDGGGTWMDRENLTRSPGVDDLYPSIPRINRQGGFYELPWLSAEVSDLLPDFVLLYQSDGAAGTYVQGDEAAPDRDRLLLAAVDAFWISLGGIGDGGPRAVGLPRAVSLAQNRPNPFNPSTTIAYSLPEPGTVAIRVYDLRGRRVRTLVDGVRDAGEHEVAWDGRDDRGAPLPGGVYLCAMETGSGIRSTRKMVLLM